MSGEKVLRDGATKNAHRLHSPEAVGSNSTPATDAITYIGDVRGKKACLQAKMQRCLDRLGVPLKAVWAPKPDGASHGEIREGCLLIYDENEVDAWETLFHEIVEYQLKAVTQVYRTLVNQLIEGFEKLAYQQKEQFIEALPGILKTVEAERLSPATNSRVKKA